MICNFHHSGDQIKKNEMGGACSKYGTRRGADRILVGKPDGKRPLGKPRLRWMLLKCIFKKWDQGHGLNWSGSGKGQATGDRRQVL